MIAVISACKTKQSDVHGVSLGCLPSCPIVLMEDIICEFPFTFGFLIQPDSTRHVDNA